jgi:orotidine-5'-phosphate decarboxylase
MRAGRRGSNVAPEDRIALEHTAAGRPRHGLGDGAASPTDAREAVCRLWCVRTVPTPFPTSPAFCRRLAAAIGSGAPAGVIGLDPRLEHLPRDLAPDAEPATRITRFFDEVLPWIADAGFPAVKPNVAFFEAHGSAGYGAYERVCARAREHGLLVVADVKRGDIGSTAEAYAAAHLALADAVTLHPWLGTESLEPFLRGCRELGKAVFVLVRTSNPSATEFQALRLADGRDVSDAVADAVSAWGRELVDPEAGGYSPVGAVVGATRPDDLVRLRQRMPHAWILVPGVGAQGGRVADLVPAVDAHGLGLLVNQSRGVLQPFAPDDVDWRDRVRAALASFADDLRALRPGGAA